MVRQGVVRFLCPPHSTGHSGPPAPVVRHGEQYHSRPRQHGHRTHSRHGPHPSGSLFSHGPHPSGSLFSHGPHPSGSPFSQPHPCGSLFSQPHPCGSPFSYGSHPSGTSFSHGPHPYSSPFMHEAHLLRHGPRSLNPYPPEDQGVTAPLPPELVDQFGAMRTSSQWGNSPPHPHDQD